MVIQHDYTDQEIEALRTEGYTQVALTQFFAWATSDEGKRFRKIIWTRISSKWLSITGRRPYTELLDDIGHAAWAPGPGITAGRAPGAGPQARASLQAFTGRHGVT